MADTLTALSEAMAALVDTAGQSIVRVEARRRLPATGIVWSADGIILTSHHIVESDDEINIGLPNGETVKATLAGRDPSTDVAVLRVQASGLTPANWTELDAVRVGHLVLALGKPGDQIQATLGVVSALSDTFEAEAPRRRPFGSGERGGHRGGRGRHRGGRGEGQPEEQDVLYRRGGSRQHEPYIQTDVVMYPGFSGGPLAGAGGQLLGMNTSGLMRGVSITVPTPTLRRVVETLITHGKVRRGYLGITAQPVKLPDDFAAQLEQEVGLMIIQVEADSPAQKGGITFGDVLVGLDGEAVQNVDELLARLRSDQVGKALTAQIVRGGQVQELEVTIGERS